MKSSDWNHKYTCVSGPWCHTYSIVFACIVFSLSEGPICRICHEGACGEPLLSPCNCTGTLGTVHKSCLEKWLSSSNTSYCELCHTEFTIERRPRPLTEVTQVNALCLVCINLSSFLYSMCWRRRCCVSHLLACLLACYKSGIVVLFFHSWLTSAHLSTSPSLSLLSIVSLFSIFLSTSYSTVAARPRPP